MRNHKIFDIYRIVLFSLVWLIPGMLSAQNDIAKGGYGDMLYPYRYEYDQTLVYKIGVDYCPASG
jgi:hypothetical protein